MDFEIREERRPHGPRKSVVERAAFPAHGAGFQHPGAARIVDINLLAGKKPASGTRQGLQGVRV